MMSKTSLSIRKYLKGNWFIIPILLVGLFLRLYKAMEGFYFKAGYKAAGYVPWLSGRPFVEVYFRKHGDLVTYDGSSNLGPLSFKEKSEVQRYGIKAGVYRPFFKKGELFGYLDVGRRIWYRGENEVIEGVLTYAEKYWWMYYGLGVGASYEFFPKFFGGIEFEAMGTHKSNRKMRADLYEGARFTLGSVYGAEIKFPLKYNFWENLYFDLTPYFTYWRIHRSDIRMISGTSYYEPASATYIQGVMAGLSYLF